MSDGMTGMIVNKCETCQFFRSKHGISGYCAEDGEGTSFNESCQMWKKK